MIYRGLGILAASFILTACGGSGSSDSTAPVDKVTDNTSDEVVEESRFVPAQKTIQNIHLVDALNKPLTEAEVVFTPVATQTAQFSTYSVALSEVVEEVCSPNTSLNSIQGHTDAQGSLSVGELIPGDYSVVICKAGESVNIQLTINDNNAAKGAVIAAPVTVNTIDGKDVVTKLPEDSLIVAVSGIIYSDEGVVANAQIALSGGVLTNGSMATAITDENGFYSLVINMNKNKLNALQNTTVQVVAEGFEKINLAGQNFTLFGAFTGINLKLIALTNDTITSVYEENFEVLYTDATCGRWTSEDLAIEYFEEPQVAMMSIVSSLPENLWHTHDSGLNIINQAYIANLVSLAPNDNSEGKVPNPVEGSKACWYGKGFADGGVEEGNFLNEYNGSVENPEVMPTAVQVECLDCVEGYMNGGTSSRPHAGALVSPRIDFSSESAPLALTFKTWWEIEAVNPNEAGFDLMTVEYQVEGEQEWNTLSRLNPLTDPVGIENLESLPYSNAGFNQAPRWLEQDSIIVDQLAGKVFKLRFTFSTVDELFNGFRGWLLDDVKITRENGNVRAWGELDRVNSVESASIIPAENYSGEIAVTVSLNIQSLNATSAQLRFYSNDDEILLPVFAVTVITTGANQGVTLTDNSVVTPADAAYIVAELLDESGNVLVRHFIEELPPIMEAPQ